MKQRSPTLEGFKLIFTQPSVGLAEIAWRWTIGFATASLLTFCAVEYLDTLPVSKADILFVRTGQPALISEAIQHIFRGSALRLVEAIVLIAIGLAIAWIVVGAYGRAATVRALVDRFRPEDAGEQVGARAGTSSLMALNFLRAAATVAALVSCVGALLVAAAASPDRDPSPGSAFFVFLLGMLLVWMAWSVVNWFLTIAAVFVVAQSKHTFAAIAATVDLCRREAGSMFAAGTWFGIAHVVAFFVATSVVAFPFAFIGLLPGAVVFGGVLLVTLLYFAAVDFLYVGRLGAYVAILELPDAAPVPPSAPVPIWPSSNQHSTLSIQPSESVDKGEVILSDGEGAFSNQQ